MKGQKKKKWARPMLIILARDSSESVLDGCKLFRVFIFGQPGYSISGCFYQVGEVCDITWIHRCLEITSS